MGARTPSSGGACELGLCAPRLTTWDAASQGPGDRAGRLLGAMRSEPRGSRARADSSGAPPPFWLHVSRPGLGYLSAWGPNPAAGAPKLLDRSS